MSSTPTPDALHHDAVVCDLHADTLQRLVRGESLAGHRGHVDLPRMRAGGLDLQFFSVWVDSVYRGTGDAPERSYARAIELLDAFDAAMQAHADAIAPVRRAAEAREVVASGRIAAALGVEGGHAIENDLDKLEALYARGVRYMGLVWNHTTEWADAAKEESQHGTRHGGLTPFGEAVVRRMNDLGMIVDLSHAAESTFWHVLRVSRAPVMASHSDAYALSPHFRNLKDEQIRALARAGGLIGINFHAVFLDADYMRAWYEAEAAHGDAFAAIEEAHPYDFPAQAEAGMALLRRVMRPVPVPASRIVDHIEYIVRLAGEDHVALGSDFDGTHALPDDMGDVGQLPRLTRLLAERGFGERTIRKVLGENVLRFFDEVCG